MKTFFNQFGLLIFVNEKSISIMYSGLYLNLKQVTKYKLNGIDSILFYEMYCKGEYE